MPPGISATAVQKVLRLVQAGVWEHIECLKTLPRKERSLLTLWRCFYVDEECFRFSVAGCLG
jgi:hypothetical protein